MDPIEGLMLTFSDQIVQTDKKKSITVTVLPGAPSRYVISSIGCSIHATGSKVFLSASDAQGWVVAPRPMIGRRKTWGVTGLVFEGRPALIIEQDWSIPRTCGSRFVGLVDRRKDRAFPHHVDGVEPTKPQHEPGEIHSSLVSQTSISQNGSYQANCS